jgi:hypothetical protein
MSQANKAANQQIEEREVVGEMPKEYLDKFTALNQEAAVANQALNGMINEMRQQHMADINRIQAASRAIWDEIAVKFSIDVVKDTFKLDTDETTGITKLFKIIKK